MAGIQILGMRTGRTLPHLIPQIAASRNAGHRVILLVPEQYTLQAEQELIEVPAAPSPDPAPAAEGAPSAEESADKPEPKPEPKAKAPRAKTEPKPKAPPAGGKAAAGQPDSKDDEDENWGISQPELGF